MKKYDGLINNKKVFCGGIIHYTLVFDVYILVEILITQCVHARSQTFFMILNFDSFYFSWSILFILIPRPASYLLVKNYDLACFNSYNYDYIISMRVNCTDLVIAAFLC